MGPRRSMRSDENGASAETFEERVFPQEPLAPATEKDKARWKGFCEIESDPAYFNFMLKRFGVQDIKVQEIVSLEDEMLDLLPRPVYGLIFLFKWTAEDPDKQEQSCPDDVWFANQTVNYACASVALLNIVNNVPEIELGENLEQFKEFSKTFSPALRGDAISNFSFVKGIHNSFARKMDMLNTDLALYNEATSKKKSKKRKHDDDEDETGFHFIAFLPIQGSIWKLDGLERQPMCLRPASDDWLNQVKPDILERMAQYEENQIEFAILSLVRDPLCGLMAALASNVKNLCATSTQLDQVQTNSIAGSPSDQPHEELDHQLGALYGPDAGFGLTRSHIEHADLTDATASLLSSGSLEELAAHRTALSTQQADLRMLIQEEQQAQQQDEEKASARCRDIGGRMRKFARKVQIINMQE